jgi:nitroreductase
VTTLDRTARLSLVEEAARAPSAHNAQPARWRFSRDGRVTLFEDPSTRLSVADPTGRDAAIGLGAAFEGLHLALGRYELGLAPPERARTTSESLFVPVATARIVPSEPDPLRESVQRRHTYRGTFDSIRTDASRRLDHLVALSDDLLVIRERSQIERFGRVNDECATEFLLNPEYRSELVRWIRFSSAHEDWARDGLTADCLSLSRLERSVARRVFDPRVFRAVRALGLLGPLTSEARAVRSAGAIVILHRGERCDDLSTGRRFYRLLLELAGLGLQACPMSSLVESDRGLSLLAEHAPLPVGHEPVNVFRVGQPKPGPQPRSPRLPSEELLV